MRTPVFTLNRTSFTSFADLAETIANHLCRGEIVQVVDRRWMANERLCYTIQWVGDAGHVFDGRSRSLGVFADLFALVQHAETVTAKA